MTRDKLIEYCKDKGIFIPPKADRHAINAAIVRAALDGAIVDVKVCFGLWEHEASECLVCDHAAACGELSIGIPPEQYAMLIEKADQPVRFERLSRVKKAKI